jgi:hypothetical protein
MESELRKSLEILLGPSPLRSFRAEFPRRTLREFNPLGPGSS